MSSNSSSSPSMIGDFDSAEEQLFGLESFKLAMQAKTKKNAGGLSTLSFYRQELVASEAPSTSTVNIDSSEDSP